MDPADFADEIDMSEVEAELSLSLLTCGLPKCWLDRLPPAMVTSEDGNVL
jgi:hypothetical protein